MQPLILAEQTRQGVADFLETTFPATTPGFEDLVARFIAQPGNLAKGPYVTVGLPFRKQTGGRKAFDWLSDNFIPHAHQARSFARLAGDTPLSTLVATGTGSGKTECFLYPVLEHCRQLRKAGRRGIKAILVYPMNALATDQANRLAKEIVTRPELAGITAGLYVGGESGEASTTVAHVEGDRYTVITERDRIREEPPDILLTNYKMLDFLLIRARDSELWRHNEPDTLRFLVVDELHTFDGAQGTDLACLIRRLKARLRTPPGALACVGTSATLGTGGTKPLIDFARDVFGEPFDEDAVIDEDRESVAEYLEDCSIEYVQMPSAAEYVTLSPLEHGNADAYIAAQYGLWFGTATDVKTTATLPFKIELGRQLKQHVAFQNLLRDLNRQGGKSVAMADMVDAIRRRLRDAVSAPDDYPERWVLSLLSLVSHAGKDVSGGTVREAFLSVRIELWMRELRRMVASLSAEPRLVHSDDLPAKDRESYLPLIHCRDCHAMGWGATLTKTDGSKLKSDLQAFYAAFFSNDVSTRFIFPADISAAVNPKKFERRQACPVCRTLNAQQAVECSHCGSTDLLPVDVSSNERKARRNGAAFTISHHDCPYCDGDRTLTIVGSQAASLASVAVGQLFGSSYNADKKLIAFSDSVQDAAHRAGFFEARTWRLNLRPAMAQVIHDAVAAGKPLTLAELPAAFKDRWEKQLGDKTYIKTFLPPAIAWLRDYDKLLHQDVLPTDGYLQQLVHRGLTWAMQGEFAQDAHVGRTLPRTRTASLAFNENSLETAAAEAMQSLHGKVDALREISQEEVLVFMRGFLARMMRVGAIWDDFLVTYARYGCNLFVYRSNNPAEYAMLKSPRRPKYLSLLPYNKCDAVTGDEAAFYRDWAFKSLDNLNREAFVDDSVIADIYRVTLQALESQGLAQAVEAEQAGTQVWGLRPDACHLLDVSAEWRCDKCHNSVIDHPTTPIDGTVCRQLGCNGHYVQHTGGPTQFYRQLYLTADIKRILAREHTGLLERGKREQVESDFKQDKVNLLSATPTLEMGIDIGDLSAVLLCSVPPAQANYLQRVGRAGRKTGNAFMTTLAAGRPHDLYFWSEPREMLAGNVDSPGIFLNASAVLERQLTAFTLDCWVRENGDKAKVPGKLADVMAAIRNKNQTRFPYPWLSYIDQQRATLLVAFIDMFKTGTDGLTPESEIFLEKFIEGKDSDEGSLSWKIVNRLHGVSKDVDDLKSRRKRIDTEVERIEKLPAKGESDLLELKEMQNERAALTKLIASISDRDSLQFLTDEGLLPNYAFPEQGVLLHSVIVRDDKKVAQNDGDRVLTFEYERPGASAITELVPNSAFYAEGRKVTIDQVDVSRDKTARWRFCRSCSYAEPESMASGQASCPRCGDTMWSDAGRVQSMLRLTKVYARTLESKSRIGDDADDRERHFYVRQALVDVSPNAVRQAWAIESKDFPFAFEFLDRVRFREINFGEQTGEGQPIQIAGNDVRKPGFLICPECGTLQRRRNSEETWKNHALYCSKRKQPEAATQECVFLYREFDSEGIRLYLPESTFGGSEDCVQSFIAALQMGLEKRFRGSVDHLRIARDILLAQGQETPRQYLVIYDSVPGGTGYLKELMRDASPLFEVFKLALESLNTCGCISDEHKDGCYRCLYGYHNSYERIHVSRRTAARLLTEIVGHQGALKPIKTIGEVVANNSLFDSELERRFIEALRRKPTDGSPRFDVKEEIVRGKPGYFVKALDSVWRIEPQVELGSDKGVTIKCKPDFVFWPDTATGCLPIAVFLDGWQYHKDRIGDDIAKRMAIARSGKFTVWSLTYDDIAAFLEPGGSIPESPWGLAFKQGQDSSPVYQRFGIVDLKNFHTMTAFEQLRVRLAGLTDDQLQRIGVVLSLRVGIEPYRSDDFSELNSSSAGQALANLPVFAWPNTPDFGRCWSSASKQFQMAVQTCKIDLQSLPGNIENRAIQPCVVLRWADNPAVAETDQRRLWQQWWHAANLLLPLANTWAVADSECDISPLSASPVFQASSGMTAEWEEAAAYAASEVQGLIASLFAEGVMAPIVGFQLLDDSGCVVAESELAWPSKKVAVLLAGSDGSIFESNNWKAVVIGTEGLDAALRDLLRE